VEIVAFFGYFRAMGLSIGDRAPDFDVTASDGRRLSSAELYGKKLVVIYFYPGDFTPVCTAETCGFQDMYDDLVGKDTEVIGVSLDSDDSHRKFAKRYGVAFPLVADEGRALSERFGAFDGLVGALRGLMNKVRRVTYVIDRSGKIAGVFTGEITASNHTDGVRDLIGRLSGARPA
jgi:peroxiredoxin Q/BCP